MNESTSQNPTWGQIQEYLAGKFPGTFASNSPETLILPVDDEEWSLELNAQGILVCQAGYDLDDMKCILSDGTTEDLGSDELAKQAKFYLQQTVSKHRNRLKQEGFVEQVEMNDEFVAVLFEKTVNLHDLPVLEQTLRQCQKQFSTIHPSSQT